MLFLCKRGPVMQQSSKHTSCEVRDGMFESFISGTLGSAAMSKDFVPRLEATPWLSAWYAAVACRTAGRKVIYTSAGRQTVVAVHCVLKHAVICSVCRAVPWVLSTTKDGAL
jgi:hypothetical protein